MASLQSHCLLPKPVTVRRFADPSRENSGGIFVPPGPGGNPVPTRPAVEVALSETGYPVPGAAHRAEQVIDRSRFVTSIGRAADVDAARTFIDGVRAEFPDATHSCWAYVAGPPGSTAFIGLSDAGEPHGTAGRPMLDVLLHSGIGEIVVVVTRYFGGVRLGKGGLVRAYGGSVRQALESLPTVQQIERVVLSIEVGYGEVDSLRRLLQEVSAETIGESYGERVRYVAAVPAAAEERVRREVADRTAGHGRVSHGPRDDADEDPHTKETH
ncbi:hypothetical protein BH23GEM9_BH23GEM9_31920 [soil metagenome]